MINLNGISQGTRIKDSDDKDKLRGVVGGGISEGSIRIIKARKEEEEERGRGTSCIQVIRWGLLEPYKL